MYEWELLRGEQALILFNCYLLSFTFTILAACWLSLVFTEEQDKALSVSSENIAAFLMRSKCKEKKYLCPQLFGGELCKSLQKPGFPLFKFYRGECKTNSGGTNLISLKPFYLSTHTMPTIPFTEGFVLPCREFRKCQRRVYMHRKRKLQTLEKRT